LVARNTPAKIRKPVNARLKACANNERPRTINKIAIKAISSLWAIDKSIS
jgi:hypothetical protein